MKNSSLKNVQGFTIIIALCAIAATLHSCGHTSRPDSSSNPTTTPIEAPAQKQSPPNDERTNTIKRNESSSRTEEREVSADGTYSGSQTITDGVELAARLVISGSRWSTVSQLTYDSPQYENGVVDGTDLYDETATIKVGYVSGNSARINGYPTMIRE
jgi:hypothetical protein